MNELRGAFSRFQPRDTVEWFQSRGVKLKTESDGRMFPSTDDANTIAGCLWESARMAGVNVQIGASLLGVEKSLGGGFRLEVQHARVEPSRNEAKRFIIQTKRLLIATGSDRKTLDIVKSLGHTIVDPVPSLFTFNVKDKQAVASIVPSPPIEMMISLFLKISSSPEL